MGSDLVLKLIFFSAGLNELEVYEIDSDINIIESI